MLATARMKCLRCTGYANGKQVCERCTTRLVAAQRERRRREREGLSFQSVTAILPGGATPTEAQQEHDERRIDRRVLCRRYDRCLDHAIERRWEGFACSGCSVSDELTFAEVVAEQRRRVERYEVHSRSSV